MPDAIAGVTKPNLFQDWYNIAVRPRIEGNTSFTGARKFLDEAGQPLPPAPGAESMVKPPALNVPTTFPGTASLPAEPEMEVAPPAAPGATIFDSLKSGVKAVGEGVNNLSQPAKMGLLGAGLSMMATPPRQTPYTNTEILGRSGIAGIGFYEKALEDKRKADLMGIQEEEHRLTRQDRAEYNRGRLDDLAEKRAIDTRKEASQSIVRKANADYRAAQTGDKLKMQELVPAEYSDAIGRPETAGMTWGQFHASQGATVQSMKPEPSHYVTNDDGTVTLIQGGKPVTQFHGMGKTKTPTAGAKGGKPTSLAEKMSLAEKSWRQDEANKGKEPTVADIAKRAQELWPPAAVQTAAAKKKTSSLRPGAAGAAPAGNKRVKMPNGEVWEFNAAGDRVK